MAKINTEYDVGAAFEAIEEELISSMIRNMERHKVEEIEEDKQWSMWQAEQLKALEKYRKQNKKKFGKEFKEINKKIDRLILGANEDGQLDQEAEILKAIKKGFPAKKVSPGGTAEFFKVNDRKLNALLEATSSDMQKAESAVLRRANDQYRKVIFNAQVYANTGAGTYEKAVDMATKDFLSAGIDCIEYTNGSHHTIVDYADMAIRTASKRAYLQGEGTKRQEWGLHLVIMNKRGNPCLKCLPFCGKILIDDVWSGGSSKDGKYPLMSSAIAAGLYHPRCRDSHTTYFPDITTVNPKYNKQEITDIEDAAKREVKQQYAKRQEKKFNRLAKFSLDPDNQKMYNAKKEEYSKLGEVLRNDTEYQDSIQKRREEYRKKRAEKTLDKETLKQEIAELTKQQEILENQLQKIKEEEKELTKKVYFDTTATPEEATRLQKIPRQRKEVEDTVSTLKTEIWNKQEVYKNDVEKRVVKDGIFKEVKLSKRMNPETVDLLEDTVRNLYKKYGIMPERLVFSPLKVEDATATYNWIDDTIYLSNNFNDAEKYLEQVAKSEQSLVEYNKQHDIKNKAKQRLEEAETILADKSVKGYEREKARIAKVEAEIQLNETRMAVRENLTDCLVHEYGHFIHRHANVDYVQKKKYFGMKELGGSFNGKDWKFDINKKASSKAKVEAAKISRYAANDPYEAFAEGFLALEKGEKIPEQIAEVIAETERRAGAKNIAKTIDSDIIISGARITDIFSEEADEFAEMYYKEIRSFSTDAKKIAENLNKKESDIRKIKSYLFEDKSLLDTDTGEWRRFDPDCAIAQSWQRLMLGKDIKPHDKTLIEHELLEMKIKKENPNMEHWKAHEIASEKYDYPKEAMEYYGNLEKHKKDK